MIENSVIEPSELEILIEQGGDIQIVDITENNCLKSFEITSDWIPASKLISKIFLLKKDIPIILCCEHGNDSFMLMKVLKTQYHLSNIISLKSGIYGWATLRKSV